MFLNFIYSFIDRIMFFTGLISGKSSFPPPLSKEDEKKYLKAARGGDKEAKDILVRHNMRLVAHIVKKYSGCGDMDDLISVGSIGLIKAINTYSDAHGTVLATYTAKCIENEILMYIRANKKHKNEISLNSPVGADKDGNELEIMDLLTQEEDDVFGGAERAVINDKLNRVIKGLLKEREYEILRLRYGLDGKIPLTQRETALRLKISRSYISRIEKKAICKLREKLNRDEFIE